MTFTIAVAACALIIIAAITGLTALALSGEKPRGAHARRPVPAAAGTAQGKADPFAGEDDEQDPDEAADEYIAALNEPEPVLSAPVPEPETGEMPAPALTAPLPAASALEPLEPLPPSPPARRTRPEAPVITARWEPPVSRGTLESLRDALRAWNPDAPEPAPEPAPQSPGADTQEIFLNLVGGTWDPAAMADAIEASVYGDTAKDGSDENGADFAGVSVAGLPDDGWDLPAPVTLTGRHHLNGDLA